MQEDNKRLVQVVIGDKVYRLAGVEGEEYIQSLARYINKKLGELNRISKAQVEYSENFPILLALNIADDFFKYMAESNENAKNAIPEQTLSDLSDMSNQLVEATQRIQALEKELEARDAAIAKYQQAMQTGSMQFEEFKRNIAARDEEITSLREKLVKANNDITALTTKTSDNAIEIGELNKKISEKNKELNGLSVKLAEKNSALNELNKKSAERNQKLNNVNKERDELAVKLKEAKTKIAALEKDAENHLQESNSNIENLSTSVDSLMQDKQELTQKLEKTQSEYLALRNSMPKGSANTAKEMEKLNKEIEGLKNEIEILKGENSTLEELNQELIQELDKAKSDIKGFIESLK